MIERAATVPICDDCWQKATGKTPIRLREPELEICHFCQEETKSGIYVRKMVEQ